MIERNVFIQGIAKLTTCIDIQPSPDKLEAMYQAIKDEVSEAEFLRGIKQIIRGAWLPKPNEFPSVRDIIRLGASADSIDEIRKRMSKFLAFEGELFAHLTASSPRPPISPENIPLLDALGGPERMWRMLKRKDEADGSYRGSMPWDEFKAKMIGSVDWHLLQDRLTGQISAIEHQKQIGGGAESLALSVKRLR